MLDLNRAPVDQDTYTRADFVELLTLNNPDRLLTRDQFLDYLRDGSVNNRKATIGDNEADDIFTQLAWREAAFGDAYPFRLVHRNRALEYREMEGIKGGYIFLLLCANLPLLEGNHHPWTNGFERFVAIALRSWWVLPAIVKAFGKGLSDYEGQKWERMNQLAADLGGHGSYSQESFRRGDNGDGGIDLAAWREFDSHERRNMAGVLVQCACSRGDWPGKQSEASSERLLNMHVKPAWQTVMCIPQCFRNNQGKWAYDGEVAALILLDRLRLLKMLPADFQLNSINPPEGLDQAFAIAA